MFHINKLYTSGEEKLLDTYKKVVLVAYLFFINTRSKVSPSKCNKSYAGNLIRKIEKFFKKKGFRFH